MVNPALAAVVSEIIPGSVAHLYHVAVCHVHDVIKLRHTALFSPGLSLKALLNSLGAPLALRTA